MRRRPGEPADESPPAPKLDEVERWMLAVITHPGGVVAGMASPDARRHVDVEPEQVTRLVAQPGALPPVRSLGIYSHGYWARLLRCMRAEFEVLHHALGDEVFDRFAIDYLRRHPPRTYTLHQLGAGFPRHLQSTRPPDDGWPDFVIDLVILERSFKEVFSGPGAEGRVLPGAASWWRLEAAARQAARLVPVPCLRRHSFRYPVADYFVAVRAGEDPAIPGPARTHLALCRRAFGVKIHPLSAAQDRLLAALIAGDALGRAVEDTGGENAGSVPSFQAAEGWVGDWLERGLFAAIEVPAR